MKFFRHLIAVVLAVAVIVGPGMLWAHACGGGTGSGSGLGRAPSREALLRLELVKAGVIRVHSGNGFHLADTGDLIRTCVIEAVLAAVVITVGAVRRRHRRGLWRCRTALHDPNAREKLLRAVRHFQPTFWVRSARLGTPSFSDAIPLLAVFSERLPRHRSSLGRPG